MTRAKEIGGLAEVIEMETIIIDPINKVTSKGPGEIIIINGGIITIEVVDSEDHDLVDKESKVGEEISGIEKRETLEGIAKGEISEGIERKETVVTTEALITEIEISTEETILIGLINATIETIEKMVTGILQLNKTRLVSRK